MTHPIRDAVAARRSFAKVTADTPSHEELLPLVTAAARVADHGALRPWRLIELRGAARERLGAALVEASGQALGADPKMAAKPLRAELLIAVVASRRPSHKVDIWEQDATAAGVAHALSLLLAEAGWGVMWRTGPRTRAASVRTLHGLTDNEELLGWLYVGGVPSDAKPTTRTAIDPTAYLSSI
ncbi:nitroreductase family protein [Glaciibacter psychrotolerans]|uniref:Putative NAD(P)H nitroreductase n=1 Tax=Glaciibacter psychrotolerans TaxID=670054 RepID=A0A7Z0J4D8_9MICO|nr:nitroreductase [Leifsonia psychrotolerans]